MWFGKVATYFLLKLRELRAPSDTNHESRLQKENIKLCLVESNVLNASSVSKSWKYSKSTRKDLATHSWALIAVIH